VSMAEVLLAEARLRLHRLHPREAHAAALAGALLVDTRPYEQRLADGTIPGAVQHVIVVCNEGYSSSLAAASLQDLGLRNATDLIGGFQAWRASGLPVVPPT
jgi:rhodanese-related sulfurtransferase